MIKARKSLPARSWSLGVWVKVTHIWSSTGTSCFYFTVTVWKVCQGSCHVSCCLVFTPCFILYSPPSSFQTLASSLSVFSPVTRCLLRPPDFSHLCSPAFMYKWSLSPFVWYQVIVFTLCVSLSCLVMPCTFVNAFWFWAIFLLLICCPSLGINVSFLHHHRDFCVWGLQLAQTWRWHFFKALLPLLHDMYKWACSSNDMACVTSGLLFSLFWKQMICSESIYIISLGLFFCSRHITVNAPKARTVRRASLALCHCLSQCRLSFALWDGVVTMIGNKSNKKQSV